MGSAVKWVFYALFGTNSTVKLFNSFEYQKIPGFNSLWRFPLYSGTIFKSWIQLWTVSIFALPKKSPPFRLSHFASEKLLNVYVLHFLDKQWIKRICTTNNHFKRSRKKGVSLEEFSFANKKHSQFFWGQYTVHTGNWSLVTSD